MDGHDPNRPEDEPGESAEPHLPEAAEEVLATALHLAQAHLRLLRAELRLARASALALIGFAFAFGFLGVTAWLAICAALAVAIQSLTGSLAIGIAALALANLAGMAIVFAAMRRCWSDLGLPRTRRLLQRRQPA
jgi:hypothetical protein